MRLLSPLGSIAPVEALKVIVELLIRQLDELGQRGTGEIAVLVVDCLDPCAIHRQQLAAEQVQLLAQQHELAERREVVAAEVGDGLKVGLRWRSSQITSTLRWVSASSRRLERMRFR